MIKNFLGGPIAAKEEYVGVLKVDAIRFSRKIADKNFNDIYSWTARVKSTDSKLGGGVDDEVEKSKAADLRNLLQPGFDLQLAGVLQTSLEAFQDGLLLVLTSANDEGEAEAIAIPAEKV